MPITTIRNLQDVVVYATNPVAGTPAGSKVSAPSPARGRIVEVGFVPSSLVTSAMTLSVLTNDLGVSSTTSNYATVVTSTLGSFAATNLFEGAAASVTPASPTYVNAGDGIQWVTSGGQSSTVAATLYAVIRKG
jgi:uncharacterized protein (DUF1501 family)